MHPRHVQGRPDFYFPEERVALFVDGCFWHGCKRCCGTPKTNSLFWREKVRLNRARDRRVARRLRRKGVAVLRVWEHDVRRRPQHVMERLTAILARPVEVATGGGSPAA